MLEKRTIINTIDTRPEQGVVTIVERTWLYEDGNRVGNPIQESRRTVQIEPAAPVWQPPTEETDPVTGDPVLTPTAYAEASVVTHGGVKYIATVETTEEPGTGTDWEALPPLTATERLNRSLRIAASEATKDTLTDLTLEERNEALAMYPAWRRGEPLKIGDVRTHNGTLYTCALAHTPVGTWTPDVTPNLWNVVPLSNEWVEGVPVEEGDVYTYNGVEYVVILPHTTQVTWEPPNATTLWAVA